MYVRHVAYQMQIKRLMTWYFIKTTRLVKSGIFTIQRQYLIRSFAKSHVSTFRREVGVETDLFIFFAWNQIWFPARHIALWPTFVKKVQTIYNVCLKHNHRLEWHM